jgi:CheY-like chemotaxis protein
VTSGPAACTAVRSWSEDTLSAEAIEQEIKRVERVAGDTRTESILIVEDNDDVRAFASEALRDYGFNVLEAPDASEALRVLDGKGAVDLLLTDIGLPGVNGRELVAMVQRKHATVRLLFMSGYAQMQSPTNSRWVSEVPLLSKPFTRSQLYDKVIQVLTPK